MKRKALGASKDASRTDTDKPAPAGTASPISKLPPEVLSEILQHVVDAEMAKLNFKYPISFAFVCRQWRSIVEKTRKLWSFLVIAPFKPRYSPFKISKYLEYSGNLPLHVSFNFGAIVYPRAQQALVEQAFDLVQGRRFRSIDIQDYLCLKSGNLEFLSARFSHTAIKDLTHFRLTLCHRPDERVPLDVDMDVVTKLLDHTPIITSLDVPLHLLDPAHPSCQRLRRLTLTDQGRRDHQGAIRLAKTFKLLQACPNLLYLKLSGTACLLPETPNDHEGPPLETASPIIHETLQELHINAKVSVSDIFDMLTAPNLAVLRLICIGPRASKRLDAAFLQVLDRFPKTLTTLQLAGLKTSDSVLIRVVDVLKFLKRIGATVLA